MVLPLQAHPTVGLVRLLGVEVMLRAVCSVVSAWQPSDADLHIPPCLLHSNVFLNAVGSFECSRVCCTLCAGCVQVVSRAHRMGATAPVHVELFAMRHTAEEHMVELRWGRAGGGASLCGGWGAESG
jgi:hypothetical protein